MKYHVILDYEDFKKLVKGEVVTKNPSHFTEVGIVLSDMGWHAMEKAILEAEGDLRKENQGS